MARRRQVSEGQLYRRVGVATGVWRVETLRQDGIGKLHAQLRSLDDPNTTKTLSAFILGDPKEYELVERERG
ncbi:MAG TPA: hypothetical protein VEB20_12790 [Azospirillaceae bacterium]|nr:hypothetical protein [Azospirillaceae bacterium]